MSILSRIFLSAAVLSAAVLASAAGLAFAGSAHAAAPSFPDPAGDSATAPDLTGLTFSYRSGDADALSITVDWAGSADLPQGSQIVVGLDTDRNPATGTDNGADYRLILAPVVGASGKVGMGFERWQGGSYVTWSPRLPAFTAARGGSVLAVMCLCDLNDPVSFDMFARSEVEGAAETDSVPDAGTSVVSLPIVHSVLFRTSPLSPVAGRSFTGTIEGIRLAADPTKVYALSTATCTAKLATATLPLSSRCRWQIPTTAAGKPLAVSIRVVYQGAVTTFVAHFKVGRRAS
jgi:hypothetical protein